MQDSKEIIKNVENKKEEKRKEIKNFKKWIKTNYKKIILWSAVITALLLSIMSYYKTYNYKSYLGHDYTVYWGGAGTTIWSHKYTNDDKHKIELYFSIKPEKNSDDIKWDGIYPDGYFDN
ncbi:hypothetical protein [Spiroplasma endosymbiont of Tricholauxania praeusta]|uniref:hypothetical protein n=1 Tax=Spiroplasma endosymbiont of Tricholauxania praeusta TaxID=3066296 RepID=UPI0030CD9587